MSFWVAGEQFQCFSTIYDLHIPVLQPCPSCLAFTCCSIVYTCLDSFHYSFLRCLTTLVLCMYACLQFAAATPPFQITGQQPLIWLVCWFQDLYEPWPTLCEGIGLIPPSVGARPAHHWYPVSGYPTSVSLWETRQANIHLLTKVCFGVSASAYGPILRTAECNRYMAAKIFIQITNSKGPLSDEETEFSHWGQSGFVLRVRMDNLRQMI